MTERPQLVMFGGEKAPQDFIDEFSSLLELDTTTRSKVLEAFASSPRDLITDVGIIKHVSSAIDLPRDRTHPIIHILWFISRQLEKGIDAESIESDLKTLGLDENQAKGFASELGGHTEKLVELIRHRRLIYANLHHILPVIEGIEYQLDIRQIRDEEGKTVERIPVAIIKLELLDDEEGYLFQSTGEELGELIGSLTEIRDSLRTFNQEVSDSA